MARHASVPVPGTPPRADASAGGRHMTDGWQAGLQLPGPSHLSITSPPPPPADRLPSEILTAAINAALAAAFAAAPAAEPAVPQPVVPPPVLAPPAAAPALPPAGELGTPPVPPPLPSQPAAGDVAGSTQRRLQTGATLALAVSALAGRWWGAVLPCLAGQLS